MATIETTSLKPQVLDMTSAFLEHQGLERYQPLKSEDLEQIDGGLSPFGIGFAIGVVCGFGYYTWKHFCR
ncbi:class IIb bacteriocin, lactobin A/cerein 7B family [Bifidobacterium bohemicum]|uniref:Uncharacterized protein n=1 Tax=Bifidobacterium bohemicum DSM 22767 TaxID=1437606 RepID=A0A086ZK82_9BIFI|nr:class IIb bacteriocin, lactobin A/cerein 7B family [Bifidobacterium bohemicum]KFI46932.1 hypothetical protein BBOH_0406 [Bifidobacterium bohemicum DSM 22767]SCB85445.1 class IIb bacteriocin, lactobin A/cerein 7B family [Bifidobacterium bohemicum]